MSGEEKNGCGSDRRTNLIIADDMGNLLPYSDWVHAFVGEKFLTSMNLLAVGCGGILYPPHLINQQILDVEGIRKCLFADDLWLKAAQLYNNIPVSISTDDPSLKHVPNSQEVGLFNNVNGTNGGNDEQLKKISEYYDYKYGTDRFFIKNYSKTIVGTDLSKLNNVVPYLKKGVSLVENKLKTAYKQKSEINAKLKLTYKQKSEINAKLKLTYKQKSEINSKLKETEKE